MSLVFFVRHRGAWIVLAGVIAASILLVRGASLSFRLAPQNWWLPLLFLVFLLAPDDRKNLLSRAQKAVVFFVTACLLYISVGRVVIYGKRAVALSQAVQQAERQGGWFFVPDPSIGNDWARKNFFHYYGSGLSGVRLPTLERCPEKAEQRKPFYGLAIVPTLIDKFRRWRGKFHGGKSARRESEQKSAEPLLRRAVAFGIRSVSAYSIYDGSLGVAFGSGA